MTSRLRKALTPTQPLSCPGDFERAQEDSYAKRQKCRRYLEGVSISNGGAHRCGSEDAEFQPGGVRVWEKQDQLVMEAWEIVDHVGLKQSGVLGLVKNIRSPRWYTAGKGGPVEGGPSPSHRGWRGRKSYLCGPIGVVGGERTGEETKCLAESNTSGR